MLKTLIAISDFYAANNTNEKEMKVLGFISENEAQSIKDVVCSVFRNVKPNSAQALFMTPLLDAMEKKKWIKRINSKGDRRVIAPVITKEGVNVWKEFENILSVPNA